MSIFNKNKKNQPELIVNWVPSMMLEVKLNSPDDFLLIKETLTRIGIASNTENKLTQSCNILHKQGHYFILHFKELFALDGKSATLTISDLQRRNRIAKLLEEWGLLKLVSIISEDDLIPLNQLKIISHKDKNSWILVNKYSIGNSNRRHLNN
jgi:hypothetical protein